MFVDTRFDELIAFARQNRIESIDLAKGLCLDASVELSRQAIALGLGTQCQFIRWHVPNDLHFRDHWAVTFSPEHCLDMTAVQIDGNPEPLRSLKSYKGIGSSPRQYPLEIVLRPASEHLHAVSDTYGPGLLWCIRRSMAKYDARQAIQRRSITALWRALMDASEALVVLGAGRMHDVMLRHLAKRLSAKKPN